MDRLSTCDAPMADVLPSGLESRVRQVSLAWIPSVRDVAVAIVAGRSWSGRCLLTPLFRRRRQTAETKATFLDAQIEIEKTVTKGYQELDAFLDRPLQSLQAALAEAGQGHRVRQR